MHFCQKQQYNIFWKGTDNLMTEKYIYINIPNVVFEQFDDEVVLINMESGTYYSLVNTAAWIWEQIADGRSLNELLSKARNYYISKSETIVEEINKFIDELQTEELINIVEEVKDSVNQTSQIASGEAKMVNFDRPILDRYTDMQDMLLLDPIHKVDETGWPTPLPDDPDQNE